MKIQKLLLSIVIVLCCQIGFAQQQGINYKALIKDANGNVLANTSIRIQFNIQYEPQGFIIVYAEDHLVDTDANGIIIANIGTGTQTSEDDGFTDIEWSDEAYYLNVEVDITGGTNYVDMGTTQFMTVPYALTSRDSYWDKNPNGISNISDDIGIGSDTLSAKLGIFHNSGRVSEWDPFTNTNPHILLIEDDNDYARIGFGNEGRDARWSINGYISPEDDGRNDRINFWNDHTATQVMTITGDGRVGVGVGITPKTDFHVGEEKRVLFGTDTIRAGDKLMWLPDLHAFRVGTLASGAASVYWDRDSIGLYSFASGSNTRAQGFGATAMGRETEGQGSYSMATGYFSNADGQYSTAMGFNTDAFGTGSTALGYGTDAEADYSFAVGHTAEAQAIYSMALGRSTRAQSYASTAIGSYNVGGGNATSWVGSSPLFEIGNGTSDTNRSNAMTVLKNGNITINGDTTINGTINSPINANPDIILGGTSSSATGDDGIISSDPAYAGSDIFIRSNDAVVVQLDFDNNEPGNFEIKNGNQIEVFDVSEAGNVVIAGNLTQNSDRRLKKDIEALPYGLEEILQLQPKAYNWKNRKTDHKSLGLIAQDVQPLIKEIVTAQDDEAKTLGISYTELIPILINAIKEQQQIINNQNSRLDRMSAELESANTLEDRVKQLEALLKTPKQ